MPLALAAGMSVFLESKGPSYVNPPAKEVLDSLVTGWIQGHFKHVVAGIVSDDHVLAYVGLASGGHVAVHPSMVTEATDMSAAEAVAFLRHECEKVVVELSALS